MSHKEGLIRFKYGRNKEIPNWKEIDFVVADKGYNNGNIRDFIKSKNAIPVIPYKGVYLPNDSNLTPEDFYDILK
ncbi:MAG: hypothetical protein LN568_05615 [Rickettsia endosymbiont of Pseudomimeciton antennatum]|nr:hypothetical protein [Rickettsia endosymbiont of Pseudomimeciton antennatum]